MPRMEIVMPKQTKDGKSLARAINEVVPEAHRGVYVAPRDGSIVAFGSIRLLRT